MTCLLFPPLSFFTLQTCFMSKCIGYSYIGDTIDQASDISGLVSCLQERKTHFRINCHQENCTAYAHWLIAGLFLDPVGILSPSQTLTFSLLLYLSPGA